MKNTLITSFIVIIIFTLSNCKDDKNNATTNFNISKRESHLNDISLKLDRLSDTSTMNPQIMNDIITYDISSKIPNNKMFAIQRDFIFSSGFPLVNTSQYDNKHLMPSTFEEADKKYKDFVAKEFKNPFINVFKQNTASLIIRKYLLNNSSKKDALQFYTETLLQSHSQNYPLIYLSILQLKQYVGAERINKYKNLIQSDPVIITRNKNLDAITTRINERMNHSSSTSSLALTIMAKSTKVSKVRSQYFINKINRI